MNVAELCFQPVRLTSDGQRVEETFFSRRVQLVDLHQQCKNVNLKAILTKYFPYPE